LAALLGAQDLQRRTNDLQRAKEVSLEIARDRSAPSSSNAPISP
jgi:hypothetical protein